MRLEQRIQEQIITDATQLAHDWELTSIHFLSESHGIHVTIQADGDNEDHFIIFKNGHLEDTVTIVD